MAHYIVLALPLLTAVCAWRIVVHLARSGRAVRRSPLAEATRRMTLQAQLLAERFASLRPATQRAAAAFRDLGVAFARAETLAEGRYPFASKREDRA